MMRYALALGLVVCLFPVTGCAVGPSCAGGCGVGYDSCGSCGTGELRARNPFQHARHLVNAGGCGEVYWGEWPDPSSRCDTCSVAGGGSPRWTDLWGVRRRMTTSRQASVGCSECSAGGGSHGMMSDERVLRATPSPVESIETVPPAPRPTRGLPGPDDSSQRSIMRPNLSRAAPPATNSTRPITLQR